MIKSTPERPKALRKNVGIIINFYFQITNMKKKSHRIHAWKIKRESGVKPGIKWSITRRRKSCNGRIPERYHCLEVKLAIIEFVNQKGLQKKSMFITEQSLPV